jgi:site-specific recombinase XerC
LEVCEGTSFEPRRDGALIRLLVDCGVRCSELINLTLADLDREIQVILVVGKGRRPRAVPYGKRSGGESDLMMIAGWRSRAMLHHYGASAAAERAREAHRRMAIADRV